MMPEPDHPPIAVTGEASDPAPAAELAPEKSPEAFRTIGEAAGELGLKPHVLRFWETRFEALRPMKRPDGRRYYRPEDMAVLRTLHGLLHVQGLTLRGAARAIAEGALVEGAAAVATETEHTDLRGLVQEAVARGEIEPGVLAAHDAARERLQSVLDELTALKGRVDRVRLADCA